MLMQREKINKYWIGIIHKSFFDVAGSIKPIDVGEENGKLVGSIEVAAAAAVKIKVCCTGKKLVAVGSDTGFLKRYK